MLARAVGEQPPQNFNGIYNANDLAFTIANTKSLLAYPTPIKRKLFEYSTLVNSDSLIVKGDYAKNLYAVYLNDYARSIDSVSALLDGYLDNLNGMPPTHDVVGFFINLTNIVMGLLDYGTVQVDQGEGNEPIMATLFGHGVLVRYKQDDDFYGYAEHTIDSFISCLVGDSLTNAVIGS
jgi:hypothetical protein